MKLLVCRCSRLWRWRSPPRFIAVLIAIGLAAIPAQAAKFTQQGSKLVGIDAAGGARQGKSVALSANGNTAIVGGPTDNGLAGAAWVYVRGSNGAWTQQGNKLVGTGAINADQGQSVALSADGNVAIVGGHTDDSFIGAAWVYVRVNGVWVQQGNKLVGTGADGDALQGISVALSADGKTAIVGGSLDNSSAGAAWVYVRVNGVWVQQGNKLVGTGAAGAAGQGRSVALSADGNTAIIGGSVDNGGPGAAWVFTRDNNGVWTQQGNKLVGTGAVGGFANQGTAVALSEDGNTAIVGGPGDNSAAGAAWVFTRDVSGVWMQQGNKLVGTGAVGNARQGNSVALSADGNTAVIGGWGDNSQAGAAWVFGRRRSGVWTQQGSKLVGTGATGNALQGWSVALSADGNTAIVGGETDNSNTGAAWVFGRPGIYSITPDLGSVGGGEEVVIFGTNLLNVAGITFGGAAASNVTPMDAETVIVTTPPHAAGKVNVILTTITGSSRLNRGYTYEPYPTVTFLTSSVNPATVGQSVRFKAFVSGVGMVASGRVTFKDGTQTLGTRSLNNGVATLSTSALTAGEHTIKALFRRNGMFAASKAKLRQRVKN